jgi:hypothetical protein
LLFDITIDGVSQQRVYKGLLQWRKEGKCTGGLGFYPEPVQQGERGYHDNRTIASRCVNENLLDRHMRPLFL